MLPEPSTNKIAQGSGMPGCHRACETAMARPQRTGRTDLWWLVPLREGGLLAALTGYATWAALQRTHWYAAPYVSPLYSPCLAANCGTHANMVLVGPWWRWSPALLVVAFPVGVRVTCYYYRRLYYRCFWLSPPACAVAEPHRRYSGEARFPLVLQNLHRYLWAFGIGVAVVLTLDAVDAYHFPSGWGLALGSVVLSANAVFFWLYLASCHSCRHLAGGHLRAMAAHPFRRRLWRTVSALNTHHGLYAWLSLPCVILADAYVRLVSIGALHDPHVW